MGEMVRYVRLLRRLADAGRAVATAYVACVAALALLPAATSLATSALVRVVQEGRGQLGPTAAWWPLVWLGLALVSGQVFTAAVRPLAFMAVGRINIAHRERVARLVIDVPTLELVADPRTQNLVETASGESASWVERTIGDGATTLTVLLCQLGGALAAGLVLARFRWWLLPLTLLPALAIAGIAVREAAEQRAAVAGGMEAKRRFMYFSELTIGAREGKELRIFGLVDWVIATGREFMRAHRAPVFEVEVRKVRRRWMFFLLMFVPLFAVFAAVGLIAARNPGDVAGEAAVLTCAWSVFNVVASTWNLVGVIGGLAPLTAYEELAVTVGTAAGARTAVPPPQRDPEPTDDRVPDVRFESVGFRYPGADDDVLSDLNLEIEAGRLLALVGGNGSGKSTLTKLLAGLYEPTAGRIIANGVSLDTRDAAAWRRRIAVVFQDFVRYPGSVLDNVLLGQAGPRDDAALRRAAVASGLDAVIATMPLGWHTPLDSGQPGGVDLSGGQWQQVALARVLYAAGCAARIIVLDEPTAHLDVRTEFDVFRRLRDVRVRGGEVASVVLISHRLSSVRYADRIVLLHDGRISESGTHDELMTRNGRYAQMFRIQASRFERGYDDRLDVEADVEADVEVEVEGTASR